MKGRDFSHIRSHKFRGKRYEIVWRRPKKTGICVTCCQRVLDCDDDGECDPPSNPQKAIRIDPKLPEKELLITALHEGTHAGAWDLDEAAIREIAKDNGELLWRMGWRLVQ